MRESRHRGEKERRGKRKGRSLLEMSRKGGIKKEELETSPPPFFFCFLGLHLQHTEVPRLAVKLEL